MHCCTKYDYNFDMLQVISLISAPVLPPTYLLLRGVGLVCGDINLTEKRETRPDVVPDPGIFGILYLPEYVLGHTKYFSTTLSSAGGWFSSGN